MTRCRRSSISLTFPGPNELKLHIGVHKRLFYKNIVPFILNVLLFGSSRAEKLVVLSQGWHFSAILVLTLCRKLDILLNLIGLNELKLILDVQRTLLYKIFCHFY